MLKNMTINYEHNGVMKTKIFTFLLFIYFVSLSFSIVPMMTSFLEFFPLSFSKIENQKEASEKIKMVRLNFPDVENTEKDREIEKFFEKLGYYYFDIYKNKSFSKTEYLDILKKAELKKNDFLLWARKNRPYIFLDKNFTDVSSGNYCMRSLQEREELIIKKLEYDKIKICNLNANIELLEHAVSISYEEKIIQDSEKIKKIKNLF